ncbi:MAG: 5-formyltetrahydrofolate cyclo-ligase [Thermodesulfobacteriota bacterium]|nr:5-formyltetrahydrofolate cyclo-ligase [Thermodesulfobacteriota bacterium]
MEEGKGSRKSVLGETAERLARFSYEELKEKSELIEQKLLDFANFMEAQYALLYIQRNSEISTENVIKKSLEMKKGIALPAFSASRHAIKLFIINNYDKDLIKRDFDLLEPDPEHCKKITLAEIDIAVIPGLAFDEKGGRIGFGEGFYNRLITRLPETTRKISIAFEEQIAGQIEMESRKYNVDIIITDKRVIYKI